jgi:hypothetical protein
LFLTLSFQAKEMLIYRLLKSLENVAFAM